jgi:hypothetical protein
MRYPVTLLATFALGLAAYFGLALLLTPALIPAEYWVREMITVKRTIAAQHRGQNKIIIGGGSSGLFAIDTTLMTAALGKPVLNLALHAGLPLETILLEAGRAAEPGDAIILPLEPAYYSREDPSNWQVRNMIAWQPDSWKALGVPTRIAYFARLPPSTFVEVVESRALRSAALPARRAAFDDAGILARFAQATPPTTFAYSVDHLDRLGNLRHAIGQVELTGSRSAPEARTEVGPAQRATLRAFVDAQRARGVVVVFANAPFVASPRDDLKAIDEASAAFTRAMADVGPVIDGRRDVLFAESLFFNTYLHLNEEGRRLRTEALLRVVRRQRLAPEGQRP